MSDSHLLRLARIVKDLAADMLDWKDERVEAARELVRDIEAAESQPAPRTITRAQFQAALSAIELEHGTSKAWHNDAVRIIAAAWDITVEDA